MKTESFHYPTQAEIDAIVRDARRMQALALRNAFSRAARWTFDVIAHPQRHLPMRHA